jgi:hypothetical protein
VARRNPYSRWRRLPPVFRSGQRRLVPPADDSRRLILDLSRELVEEAKRLAVRSGYGSLQEYCARLLAQAIETERINGQVAELQQRRGPLEGFNAIASDLEYLAEWRDQAGLREVQQSQGESPRIPARPKDPSAPAPAEPAVPCPEPDAEASSESRSVAVRVIPELLDPSAAAMIHLHVDPAAQRQEGFLPRLRRGRALDPSCVVELMDALRRVEAVSRSSPLLDRGLVYELHRLALESQVLLTEAWPGAFNDQTTAAIREVQEMVERILTGQDIRYYPESMNPHPEPSRE